MISAAGKTAAGMAAVKVAADYASEANKSLGNISNFPTNAGYLYAGYAATATAAGALNQAAPDIYTAGTNLIKAAPTIAYGGQGILSAAGSMINSLLIAVDAIIRAMNQAQQALNNNGSGHSTGGLIPGFGGGDIVPAHLEPGEFVVRKEVVKRLGADYFQNLNYSVSNPKAPEGSLPQSSGGSNILVNIGVNADTSVESITNNMELIADGVKRVFEEYA
jgi:hypothetical protein